MKIAQVSATFPPYPGGTGNVCYYQSIELAKLGHHVTVFTSEYTNEISKKDSVNNRIKIIRYKPIFKMGNAPFLPQLIGIDTFDIVHLHYPFVFGAEFIFLNLLIKNNNLIVTHHQELLFDGFLDKIAKIYSSVSGKLVLSKAKKILTPSLDHLFNIKNKRVRKIIEHRRKDIIEVPNGVDIKKFHPRIKYDDLKKRYGINEEKIVLFVGALDKAHYFKGVDILIKAFSKIKMSNVKLMIVGEGNLKGYYRNLAKKLGILHKVIFTGFVTNDELPKYYALSSVLVLPSISSGEIFGLVLVEAMACEKPVIASNLPGVRTVVDNEKNGFLVEPKNVNELAEKIQYILENENLARKFGKEGRKKVEEKYSWEKIAKKLEKIYIEVMK